MEAGVIFDLVQVEGDWYLIEYKHPRWGQRVGYIHKAYVRRIGTKAPSLDTGATVAAPKTPARAVSEPTRAQAQRSRPSAPPPTEPVPPSRLSVVGPAKAEGYVEWRHGDALIADGQRIRWNAQTRLKLPRSIAGPAAIPLGYELKAKGNRLSDGSILARELEAKANGVAMFEAEVRTVSERAEGAMLLKGAFAVPQNGRLADIGSVIRSGPEVERCRRLIDRLMPPTTRSSEIRVYVVDNPEWNAMAMANGSVWVFRGILNEFDDDELATVLGHELAHYTYEHTRRRQKQAYWIALTQAVAGAAISSIENPGGRAAAELGAFYGLSAWSNGYTRDQEDQADRVGLRYLYEAGFDVRRGASIWQRYAQRYGNADRVTNFLLEDHSRPADRLSNLQREIRYNYSRPRR